MLKRTFTYTDYNGQSRTEDFYFNLTRAEVNELDMSAYGGLQAMMNRLLDEKNTEEIVKIFKRIILSSVGQKSMDGRRFIKTEEIRNDFYQTEAYSQLFCELIANQDDALGVFIRGVVGIPEGTPMPTAASTPMAEQQTFLPAT